MVRRINALVCNPLVIAPYSALSNSEICNPDCAGLAMSGDSQPKEFVSWQNQSFTGIKAVA
jgi:hypothetical protein